MKSRIGRFGVLEVLIIVGVLVILVALLLPATTGGGKAPAPRTQCLSNQKQLVLAYSIWAYDNDQQFPFASTNGA